MFVKRGRGRKRGVAWRFTWTEQVAGTEAGLREAGSGAHKGVAGVKEVRSARETGQVLG